MNRDHWTHWASGPQRNIIDAWINISDGLIVEQGSMIALANILSWIGNPRMIN